MLIHICNNFISSKVHGQLVLALYEKYESLVQWVFVSLRRKSDCRINEIENERVVTTYVDCRTRVLKYFPLLKLVVTFLSFLTSVQSKKSAEDIVLAHTLWSDGGVAFFYYLITKCPYVVVVRNSDLNWFIPRLPHYRWLIKLIIKNANSIVFVTPAYKKRFAESYPGLAGVAQEMNIIPNGIDSFWLENICSKLVSASESVCFLGRFDKNKNLDGIWKSCVVAKQSIPNLTLKLIGGDKQQFLDLACLEAMPSWITCSKPIEEKFVLRNILRESGVFLMPSFHETFGLVYIESLSQGCPVIHSRDEGIQDMFVGAEYVKAVDPKNPATIAEAITDLLAMRRRADAGVIDSEKIKEFSWDKISQRYYETMYVAK